MTNFQLREVLVRIEKLIVADLMRTVATFMEIERVILLSRQPNTNPILRQLNKVHKLRALFLPDPL
jgi:hypothetical protein